jgi:predicted nucleotidyltransferase component of viral defense system
MVKLKENIAFYSNPNQRDVLARIIGNEIIKNNFFLTGGTALSVFYLHHRTSIDLDLFTIKRVPLDEIYLWITRTWPHESQRINQNEFILQMLIKDIKVDIVHDPLSFDEPREKYKLDENKSVIIDSIRNIAAGKFTTLVSRREVKDFVDFFFLHKKKNGMNFENVYQDAQKKEGMFDDSPTVAYQLENNFSFIKQNPYAFPEMRTDFDPEEFYVFYERLITKIYHRKNF